MSAAARAAAALLLTLACARPDDHGRRSPESGLGVGRTPAANPSVATAGGDGWDEATTFSHCRTRVAREPARAWAGLAWSTCGAGCRSAPVWPGVAGAVGARLGTAALARGAELVVSTSLRLGLERFLVGQFAYGEGRAESLITVDGAGCWAQFSGQRSPRLFNVLDLGAAGQTRYAWLGSGAKPSFLDEVRRSELLLDPAFDVGDGWGGVFDVGSIRLTRDPRSTQLREVYRSADLIRTPVGAGDLLVWTEGRAGRGRIMALSADDRALTISEARDYPVNVGASADRFVWLEARGERAVEGRYDSVRLHSCSRTPALTACTVDTTVELPIVSSGGTLSVRGSWAAFTGCSPSRCDAYAVHLERRELHRFSPPDNATDLEVIGLSDHELIAIGFGPKVRGTADFDRFLRFALPPKNHRTALSALAQSTKE